jgi:hypothetical protein
MAGEWGQGNGDRGMVEGWPAECTVMRVERLGVGRFFLASLRLGVSICSYGRWSGECWSGGHVVHALACGVGGWLGGHAKANNVRAEGVLGAWGDDESCRSELDDGLRIHG